jgi:hypothetical protein
MNKSTKNNDTVSLVDQSTFLQQFQQKFFLSQTESSYQQIIRPQFQQQHKTLSSLQIIEICSLCLILLEHTIIFILTFRKKPSKEILFDTK